MLREIFLWCLGRLGATTRENERKIAISQRTAHLLLLHLCKLPIASIEGVGRRAGRSPWLDSRGRWRRDRSRALADQRQGDWEGARDHGKAL
jgi:hypothetical protein